MEKQKRAPWTELDRKNWFNRQTLKRSYRDEVLTRIDTIRSKFQVTQYGALSIDSDRYPVFLIQTQALTQSLAMLKKTILITGGVHGYETSGILGALRFMEREASAYESHFNFICAPCISPWAYETINRWNPKAIDPNRSFITDSPAEECMLFLGALSPFGEKIYAHFDLHETTDTDNTVFRPALEERDGVTHEFSPIPDGFYTVGNTENPQSDFQRAIVDSVKKVTHIAPPDAGGKIIGSKLEQEGVIHYPLKKLALCAGFSNAPFTTTTEVYPDSPRVNGEICIQAQVAAIKGGLDHLLR